MAHVRMGLLLLAFGMGTSFLCAQEAPHDPEPLPSPAIAAPSPEPSAPPTPAQPTPTPVDLTLPLFQAVAECNLDELHKLFAQGADANATLPLPPPEELKKRFVDTKLEYYVTTEPGLTPLMLASAMGYADVAEFLLAQGAKTSATTKRNKTFALWLAAKFQHIDVMHLLMGIKPDSEAAQTKIRVDLKDQMAFVWRNGKADNAIPISSGRAKFPTPPGKYVVTDKYRHWKSTIYRVKMPYFLRLSCGDFGLHAGYLPGYPASHGCIRLPEKDAIALFDSIPVGTLVEIQ